MTELDELQRMAQIWVIPKPSPPETPTIENEITAKQIEFEQYHDGTMVLPTDPVESQVLHDKIRDDLAALKVQNDLIIEENRAAIARVNQENADAIAAYITDPVNIATAQNTITKQVHDIEISRITYQYDQQLTELSRAYTAAMILGDETSMAENRAAYQALLAEFNTAIAGVP